MANEKVEQLLARAILVVAQDKPLSPGDLVALGDLAVGAAGLRREGIEVV